MPASPSRPIVEDRAVILAFRAWGEGLPSAIEALFAPALRDRLLRAEAGVAESDPEACLAALREIHAAEFGPDPHCVHPSWATRALQGESPAVRAAVLSALVGPWREAIVEARETLEPDGPANPDALAWARGFWAERLVGGMPPGPDDPPVVRAIGTLSPRSLLRLVATVALAKRAWADLDSGDEDESHLLPTRERLRLAFFRGLCGEPSDGQVATARVDLRSHMRNDGRTSDLRSLGLVTFARLLTEVEPFRVRWALQHFPYEVAKVVRSRMTTATSGLSGAPLLEFEGMLLREATERLLSEGLLTADEGGDA